MRFLRSSNLLVLGSLASAIAVAPAAPAEARSGGCARAQASIAQVSPRVIGSAVLCLVNRERDAENLPALREHARLRAAARRFSREMVARRFFDHVSPSGSTLTSRAQGAGYGARSLGENIGWGSGGLATPAAIVRAWMNSPPHRAVILNGSYRDAGVGVASGSPLGGAGATFVLDVGTR